MMRILGLPLLILVSANMPLNAEDADPWGTRTASPAVVHPATISPLQKILSLPDAWNFVTDPQLMGRHRMGKGPGWNEPDWSNVRSIQVPGCWEAQGVGQGRLLRVCGFDVLTDSPERTALLAAMLDYVRTDAFFAPQATLPASFMSPLRP
jgi:hypothetical protein